MPHPTTGAWRTTAFPEPDYPALAAAATARLKRRRDEDREAARRGLDWTPRRPDPADANYWKHPY